MDELTPENINVSTWKIPSPLGIIGSHANGEFNGMTAWRNLDAEELKIFERYPKSIIWNTASEFDIVRKLFTLNLG